MLLCICHKDLIPIALDHLPGKGFQGSQIYLLYTFHSALAWKKGCLRCRDWAVGLTGKQKEWPNWKRRLGRSFVKLSPFLFCLWSPSSDYGCSIVLYRLKRYLAFINAWQKINVVYVQGHRPGMLEQTWSHRCALNWEILESFDRKGGVPFITISGGVPHLWATARNASAVLFLFSWMYALQISTAFRILGRTVIKR